jgi:Ser/Thr protein kinase RdoA (MazF antagonist)
MLWTDEGPHFVDLDDTRMGPAVQDLWMLLSGKRSEMAVQLGRVLAGYEDFRALDLRGQTAAVEEGALWLALRRAAGASGGSLTRQEECKEIL